MLEEGRFSYSNVWYLEEDLRSSCGYAVDVVGRCLHVLIAAGCIRKSCCARGSHIYVEVVVILINSQMATGELSKCKYPPSAWRSCFIAFLMGTTMVVHTNCFDHYLAAVTDEAIKASQQLPDSDWSVQSARRETSGVDVSIRAV
jgi:hypothetical protein